MHDFGLYFSLGRQHIMALSGLDHILFLLALCLRYQPADWKKLLVLITAFTIGHTITLVLSVLSFIHVSTRWIEFFIPLTIFITAISNLFVKKFTFKTKMPLIYFFALFFGLIHGLGFSNYLRSLLGRSLSIVPQLLAFNLGLELGQVVIVLGILFLSFVCVNWMKFSRREYVLFLSGGTLGVSLQMMLERLPW